MTIHLNLIIFRVGADLAAQGVSAYQLPDYFVDILSRHVLGFSLTALRSDRFCAGGYTGSVSIGNASLCERGTFLTQKTRPSIIWPFFGHDHDTTTEDDGGGGGDVSASGK